VPGRIYGDITTAKIIMSLRYAHTLIPTSASAVPTPAQVQSFLSNMIARGAIPGEVSLTLRTPSTRTRQGINPFTRQLETWPMKDHTHLQSATQAASAIAKHKDYEIVASGFGRPKHPPIPLNFTDPYHLGITCIISSTLRTTSDHHHRVPHYGDPCTTPTQTGYFTNPHTTERIEVPNAGCAQFWIEFELGKSLFPPLPNQILDILNPDIIQEAQNTFALHFVQGCHWG
jgi:hypothetical protein